MNPHIHLRHPHWHLPHPHWHATAGSKSHLLHNQKFWLIVGLVSLFAFFLALALWTGGTSGPTELTPTLPMEPFYPYY